MPETIAQRTGRHEGYREFEYLDTEGFWTIGVGHRCKHGEYPNGIKYVDALKLLDADLAKAQEACERKFPWLPDGIRKEVIIELCFWVGIGGLLKFKKMLSALEKKDFKKASDELMASLLFKQIPKRTIELANILLNGHE